MRIIRIDNISNQLLTILIQEDEDSVIFPASGVIYLQSGRKMEVEEDRIDVGQIEEMVKNRQVATVTFIIATSPTGTE